MTAGTVHPKPISIGTKLLPDKPILRSRRSMMKATRAIYPVSSKMERKKNRVTMTGRKLNTLPTPFAIPSITSECTTGLTFMTVSPASIQDMTPSTSIVIPSDKNAPIPLNVMKKTNPIMPIKHGIAVYLPVRIRSRFVLLLCSTLSCGRMTVLAQRSSRKEKRILASAASLSNPDSLSRMEIR